MSYSFNPMSDKELEESDLASEGKYQFEVIGSTRKVSKSGNDMAELKLRFWDEKGQIHFIYDYLVFSNITLNIKKVSHFCKAVGLEEEYKKGCLREDLTNFGGYAEIGIKDEQPNPNGGTYPKKNVVIDYLVASKVEKPALIDDQFNDAIPF